jgi:hypothetical protein
MLSFDTYSLLFLKTSRLEADRLTTRPLHLSLYLSPFSSVPSLCLTYFLTWSYAASILEICVQNVHRPPMDGTVAINRTAIKTRSQGSSVSVVSDCGLDDEAFGFDPWQIQEDFPPAPVSRPAHPASCSVGTRVSFAGVKARPGRDSDHSPPSSAEVNNE